MNKPQLLLMILANLEANLKLLTEAAKSSHHAATHEECQPDNKYDTTALEASYLAQGQANRAQEIRLALESYRNLQLQEFTADAPVRLTALVTLEADDGEERLVFLGPAAGGLMLKVSGVEVVVITPHAPLGQKLLGRNLDDEISINRSKRYTITRIC
ncbi:MAG TPA: transcription elongation factor GreAB [Geothermobacteraceae bacterium]|nr:transcription elongation factor GreAB [Geothermobacteraceae bacterium]